MTPAGEGLGQEDEGVTIIWRDVTAMADITAILGAIWDDDRSKDTEVFRASIKRVVFLCPHCQCDVCDLSLLLSGDEDATLSCEPEGTAFSWSCCQMVQQTPSSFQCSRDQINIQLVPLPGQEVVLELAAIRAVADTPLVIIAENDIARTPAVRPSFHCDIFVLSYLQVTAAMMSSLLRTTKELDVISGPFGFIMGQRHLYAADTTDGQLEVDFVQGAWCVRKEWLGELLSGGIESHIKHSDDIPVQLSTVLWSRRGLRTVALGGRKMVCVE